MRKKNTLPPEFANHSSFYVYCKMHCQELCDVIAAFLKSKYDREFSVCIKMIERKSVKKSKRSNNIGDVEVFTFCRGGVEHIKRENEEKKRANSSTDNHFCIPISNNSDFYNILSNDEHNRGTSIFACSNLRMHERISNILGRQPYRNSTPKYWKFYRSTVVVPIRIEKQYLRNEEDDSISTGSYQTVGFLCIDCRKTFSKAIRKELEGYINGFGQSLYELFQEIGIMDRTIEKIEGKKAS